MPSEGRKTRKKTYRFVASTPAAKHGEIEEEAALVQLLPEECTWEGRKRQMLSGVLS
ncbi:hypothetical protein KY284_020717 [Solanum tuberosum]|nr:hypothetical protein KY284_020717 [Solanum tuberosum]